MLPKSSIKIGSSIMMVMAVFTFVILLLWASVIEVMSVSAFLAYAKPNLSHSLAEGFKSAELWLGKKRLWGFRLLAMSLLTVVITAKSYRNGEKWSWHALLFTGCIFCRKLD